VTSAVATGPGSITDLRLGIEAMATRFELVLSSEREGDEPRLRAIGEEALTEIARIETRLSVFQPASDISWINAHASHRAVKVEPKLFGLLQRCLALSEATEGAFDITVGPLMRLWKVRGAPDDPADQRPLPAPELVAEARGRVGYEYVRLDSRTSTIRFAREGMGLDLGAAGKGYAIGEAIAILRAHGCTSALLHGGTSSLHAIGQPLDGDAWRIGWNPPGDAGRIFELRGGALAVSAVHGQAFWSQGRQYGHVVDPRTGWPTGAATSAVVTGPESLECDALSTALLVLGVGWLPTLRARFPDYDGYAASPIEATASRTRPPSASRR
jgi:thiamine biosynthesis lipoprotein